jgi:hypothetical protein
MTAPARYSLSERARILAHFAHILASRSAALARA